MKTRSKGRPETTIRWTVHLAATEFGRDRETLTKLLRAQSILPGDDGKYSTLQIVKALYHSGGTESESRRLLNVAKTERLQMEMQKLRERWIPVEDAQWFFKQCFAGMNAILKRNWQRLLTQELADQLVEQLNNSVDEVKSLARQIYDKQSKTKIHQGNGSRSH